ncbi:MAG: M48 family metallopeptidase [Candidatus Diapherotrites archaeon]|nr:M48 family metallopeptidase [Candidatus Diapherotrites archaeon]
MWDAAAANRRNGAIILFIFILFIFGLVWLINYIFAFGEIFLVLALFIAFIFSFSSYYYSDKIVLMISGAKPVSREENPYLYHLVDGLAIAAGIPKPRCYIIEDTAPNAFATGRNPENAVICVTSGLLSKMNRAELEGVIAHEMSHIKNYDIRYMAIVAVLVGTVVLLSDWMFRAFLWGGSRRSRESRGGGLIVVIAIIAAIIAPIVATLIKLALSRQREYLADADAVALTRYPEGLASALEKLAADKEPLEAANRATAHLYIVNPLKSDIGSKVAGLFSTHPPIEERIKRLRAM